MRRRRRKHLLEITTGITVVPGVSFTIDVSPVTLNDGEIYELHLPPGIAIPPGATGSETVFINVSGLNAPIVVGDRRARNLLSERVRRYRILRMLFTQDSIITQGAIATPAFIAFEGIIYIP